MNLSVSLSLDKAELRLPASASHCLRLAGRCPNSDSLFPPLAAVVVVAPIAVSYTHLTLPTILRV